jgi:hypothetical protein
MPQPKLPDVTRTPEVSGGLAGASPTNRDGPYVGDALMPTTTTPESRARIAYAAYVRAHALAGLNTMQTPLFDDLPAVERAGWLNASRVLWELATTGRTEL